MVSKGIIDPTKIVRTALHALRDDLGHRFGCPLRYADLRCLRLVYDIFTIFRY
jgi:hypothetical protein